MVSFFDIVYRAQDAARRDAFIAADLFLEELTWCSGEDKRRVRRKQKKRLGEAVKKGKRANALFTRLLRRDERRRAGDKP